MDDCVGLITLTRNEKTSAIVWFKNKIDSRFRGNGVISFAGILPVSDPLIMVLSRALSRALTPVSQVNFKCHI